MILPIFIIRIDIEKKKKIKNCFEKFKFVCKIKTFFTSLIASAKNIAPASVTPQFDKESFYFIIIEKNKKKKN